MVPGSTETLQDHSNLIPSHLAVDPSHISSLNPDDDLSGTTWKSTSGQRMMTGPVLERYLLGEQEREMNRIEREHGAHKRILSCQEDDQSGSKARHTDSVEEQIHDNELTLSSVIPATPVSGEHIGLTTNTALAWTQTTSTNPLIAQSVSSCKTTSV